MTLPRGWVRTELGSCLASVRTGPFGSSVHKSDYVFGGAPLINPMHIVGGTIRPSAGTTVAAEKARELAEFQLAEGDVILGRRGEMGRCAVAGKEAAGWLIGTGSMALSPGKALDPVFLQKWLSSDSVIRILEGAAVGSTMVNLNQSILLSLTLALPPAAEQRRIVAKLDALTARLARARAELDRVPVLASKLRQQVLETAFAGLAKFQPLGNCTEFVTSGSRGWAQYYSDVGPAFVRVGDVRRGNVALRLDDLQRVEPPAGAEAARTAVRPGDIVVTITADLGRVGVIPQCLGPGFVNQHVALARLRDPALAEWIAWYLTSCAGQEQLLAKDRGVTKAGLGLDDIRNVAVPIASAQTRDATVATIKAAFARADRLEADAVRANALLDRIESAILAKAFRGELVPQDPEDEPASVLLDRIRARRAAAPKAKRGRRARETADA